MNTKLIYNIEQFVLEIPKVELHLHLEGAIPLETLFNFIQRRGGEPSIKNLDDLRRRLNYTDFAHFLDVWVWKNTFIKEEKDFEEIAYQVLCNLSKQNVKYVEAHYAPGDYWRQGLSEQRITECLIKGKQKARDDFDIGCELILDICRDSGPEKGMERLNMLTPYLGKGLIGIGLGGSEQTCPADPYTYIYKAAKERGFRLTAHAGEAAGPESIWAVIEKLGVERIGHGVRANEDPRLVSLLKQKQIPLEVCVISNVRTGVCDSIKVHPIKQYFEQGLMVTVNSDDPVMFNTTISQEYLVLVKELDFSINDLKRLSINGIKASFMSDNDKKLMEDQFEKEWGHLINKYS